MGWTGLGLEMFTLFRTRLLVTTVGALLVLTCGGAAAPHLRPRQHQESTPPICAFTSHQIWDTGNGTTIKRLGMPQQAVCLLRSSSSRPTLLTFNPGDYVGSARLAPSADRLVYTLSHPVDTDEHGESLQVRVASISGVVERIFVGATDYAWSGDGRRLALLFGHRSLRGKWVSDSVSIWTPGVHYLRTQRSGATRVAWGIADTLFLGYQDYVDALDTKSWSVSRTLHRWPNVSPDGIFSWGNLDSESFRLSDDHLGQDRVGRVLRGLRGKDRGTYYAEPFWVRTTAKNHLLCISMCPAHGSDSGEPGCITAVVDPKTGDLLESFPGRLIAPTTDRTAAVVLRGDSLARVDFGPWPDGSATTRVAIEMERFEWAGEPNVPSEETDTLLFVVHPREYLEWPRSWEFGQFKLLRAVDADHAWLQFEGVVLSAPSGATAGDSVPISRDWCSFHTQSSDAGASFRVRLRPDLSPAPVTEVPRLLGTHRVVHREFEVPPDLQFASDSLIPAMNDPARARWVLTRLQPIRAKFPSNSYLNQIRFRALLAAHAPPEELAAAADTILGRLPPPSPVGSLDFPAHCCLDLAVALRDRGEALPTAERYARLGASYSGAGATWLHGYAMRVLASIQRAEDNREAAVATLRAATDSLHETEQDILIKDLRMDLGLLLGEMKRADESIEALFESAAIDPADTASASEPLRRIWVARFGNDDGLEERLIRARKTWNQWPGGMSIGTPEEWAAPEWALPDLEGKHVSSSSFAGRPLALLFTGGWSESNRAVARLASGWSRRARDLGVDVVAVDWELPGPGPVSLGAARAFAEREHLPYAVLLDHDQSVFRAFSGRAYPELFLIDARGRVRLKTIGWVPDWSDSLTAHVAALGHE